MARFVLVHGAWHGGWCFQWLREELEERGHDVEALDLPCDRVGVTHASYAELIGPRPGAVVVAHSLAAQSVALVEARSRVYLGALLPVEGAASDAFAAGFGGTVRDEHDRSYWPDAATCAAKMYPDCTRTCSDWAFTKLRRQARMAYVVVPLDPHDVIVVTTRDAAIDPEWQARVARANGLRAVELDAGHSPFFTQPDDLADLLDAVV